LHKARIYDDKGVDVTPKPLIPKLEQPLKKNQSDLSYDGSIGSNAPSTASFMQYRSMFSGSMTDTSVGSGLATNVNASMMTGSFMGSGMEGITAASVKPESPGIGDVATPEDEFLTYEDLEKNVDISLSETDTIWLLDIPSTWVAPDSDDTESIQKQNQQYQELCKNRPGNDRYSERGMQTINEAQKSKYIQTDEILKKTTEVYASDWERHDTFSIYEQQELTEREVATSHTASHLTSRVPTGSSAMQSRPPTSALTSAMASGMTSVTSGSTFNIASTSDVSMYSMDKMGLRGEEEEEEKLDPSKPNDHPILKLDSLKDNFRIMERGVTLNIYQSKQARYRNLPVLLDPDSDSVPVEQFTVSSPHLNKLWGFKCPLSQGRPVTCITWNPANKDIFAVGYGDFNLNEESSAGLICCWSLKNIEHPERIYYAQAGITSLSFSQQHPNHLAAGLYNGSVVLYNCRSTAHEPVMTSRDALFKHAGPVWQIQWTIKERSFGENQTEALVSIGVDGRVLQWTIRKGFESIQLMKLKRMIQTKPANDQKLSQSKSKMLQQQKKQSNKKSKQKKGETDSGNIDQQEGYISQHAPGLGFAFWESDTNIYLVCTEEGYIHKCSCSYNEQFLETYNGHTGPVYKVIWNPVNKDLFLSCSSDWSIRLWHQDKQAPLHIFQVTQQEISKSTTSRKRTGDKSSNDQGSQEAVWCINWCPYDPTMFGCVRGSRIEVWNMRANTLDPIIVYRPVTGYRQTYIQFSHNSDILLVGDCKGEVSVYIPKNLPPKPVHEVC
jgi:WD40 repeat protein